MSSEKSWYKAQSYEEREGRLSERTTKDDSAQVSRVPREFTTKGEPSARWKREIYWLCETCYSAELHEALKMFDLIAFSWGDGGQEKVEKGWQCALLSGRLGDLWAFEGISGFTHSYREGIYRHFYPTSLSDS